VNVALAAAEAVARDGTAAPTAGVSSVVVRRLGRVHCADTIEAMRSFTETRGDHTPDEIWVCEHLPTYTQGVAGRAEHVLNPQGIAVLQTNRGGQVTYHGPGQVVVYPLIDLKRLGIFVKEHVYRLEHGVIKTLESYGVTGHRVAGAPGIYVRLADPFGHAALTGPRGGGFDGLGKIAALGVKVTRHRTYHGVALNVAMDLAPFQRINPCGHAGLQTVDLATLGVAVDVDDAVTRLADCLSRHFSP
jgi:lipoyl(octanoyl) transferase